MNHDRFQKNVQMLYKIVDDLETMFPGRPFTPDGHMVGSLGECLVADAYGLELMSPSNKGFDAVAPDGRKIEIKEVKFSHIEKLFCINIFRQNTLIA